MATTDSMSVAGTAVLYNKPTDDRGGFRFLIKPRAFEKFLKTRPDVPMLVGHDSTEPVARTANGTLRLTPTSLGVDFIAQLVDMPASRSLHARVQSGLLDGMSIRLTWSADRAASKWTVEDGQSYLEIHEGGFDEISAVLWPAIKGTSIRTLKAVNSAPAFNSIDIERKRQGEIAAIMRGRELDRLTDERINRLWNEDFDARIALLK